MQNRAEVNLFSKQTFDSVQVQQTKDWASRNTYLVGQHKEIPHSVGAALTLQSWVPSCSRHTIKKHTKWGRCKILGDTCRVRMKWQGKKACVPIFLNQLVSSESCSAVNFGWCETVCNAAVKTELPRYTTETIRKYTILYLYSPIFRYGSRTYRSTSLHWFEC